MPYIQYIFQSVLYYVPVLNYHTYDLIINLVAPNKKLLCCAYIYVFAILILFAMKYTEKICKFRFYQKYFSS